MVVKECLGDYPHLEHQSTSSTAVLFFAPILGTFDYLGASENLTKGLMGNHQDIVWWVPVQFLRECDAFRRSVPS